MQPCCNNAHESGTSTPLSEKEIVNHRYTIIKELGAGGMAQVFLAQDLLKNNHPVALKRIHKPIYNRETSLIFKREFEIMTRLKHPNLVRVFDFGYDNEHDCYFITMEYIDGPSLNRLLSSADRFSLEKSVSLIVDLCRALTFIHSRNVIHRDINPNNIMISAHSSVTLMDFGLADLDAGEHRIKGTFLYMAPEIFSGNAGPQSDIFALGITFFELVTSTVFYNDHTSQHLFDTLRHRERFETLQKINLKKIEHAAIASIIKKMTAYDIDQRYQNTAEIIADINDLFGTHHPFETETTRIAYILGPRFVGRRDEWRIITEWMNMPERSTHALWVQADAGIGKSRLFHEFKNYCQLHDIVFFEGSSDEHIQIQFTPFIQILDELLLYATPDQLCRHGSTLKKILPDHTMLQQIETAPLYDPQTEHYVMTKTITACIIDCCSSFTNGCVLYLNDMHWSDNGSIEVVDLLLKELSSRMLNCDSVNTPCFLYVSSRNEGAEIRTSIESKELIQIMHLPPFDQQRVKSYLEAAFGETSISGQLLQAVPAIYRKVGGSPFFLQEVVKAMITSSAIVRQEKHWDMVEPFDQIGIPKNLKELLIKRLQHLQLNSQEQRAVQIIALLNRTVSWDELQGIIPVDISFLLSLAENEILAMEYHERHAGFRIGHDLISEAIIDTIEHKPALHESIANRLESMHAAKLEFIVEELAHHYYQSGNTEKACTYLDKAGKRAKNSFENEKALTYFDTALALVGETVTAQRIDLMLNKAKIHQITGNMQSAVALYKDTAHLAEQVHDYSNAAMGYWMVGFCLSDMGDASCIPYAEKCLTLSKLAGNRHMITRYLNLMGYYNYFILKNYEKAIDYHYQGIKVAQETDDTYGLLANMTNISQVFYAQGNYPHAIEYGIKAMHFTGESNEFIRNRTLIHGLLGTYYAAAADYNTAFHYFNEGAFLCEKTGCFAIEVEILVKKGETLFNLKRFDEARQVHDQATSLIGKSCDPEILFRIKVLYAKILYVLDSKDAGKQALIDLITISRDRFETAALYYELWCMEPTPAYRQKALAYYEEIVLHTSNHQYKQRLRELKDNKPGQRVKLTYGKNKYRKPPLYR